jgi:hypothetical protein
MKTWKKVKQVTYILKVDGSSVVVDSKVWQHQQSLNGICLFVFFEAMGNCDGI